MPFAQQITGINILVVYINGIFQFNTILYQFIGLITNSISLVFCLFTAFLSARLGRKPLLIGGLGLIMIFNILIGISFLVADSNVNDVPQWTVILSAVASILYFAVFGASPGPIVWQYVPEIVDNKIVGVASLLNWAFTTLIVFFYPPVGDAIGRGAVFLGLAGILIIVCLVLMWRMKETKDLT